MRIDYEAQVDDLAVVLWYEPLQLPQRQALAQAVDGIFGVESVDCGRFGLSVLIAVHVTDHEAVALALGQALTFELEGVLGPVEFNVSLEYDTSQE